MVRPVVLRAHRDVVSLLVERDGEVAKSVFAAGATLHVDGHAVSAGHDADIADVGVERQRPARRNIEGLVDRTVDRCPGSDAAEEKSYGQCRSNAIHGALRKANTPAGAKG